MLRKFLFLVFILLVSSLVVLAQEQLPDDANECNEGGSMAGKCNVDFNEDGEVSDFEVIWAWTCGWYMARYNAGIYAEVPSYCQSLLPSDPIIEGSGGGDSGPAYCSYAYESIYYIYLVLGDGSYEYAYPSDTTGGYPPCEGKVPLPG